MPTAYLPEQLLNTQRMVISDYIVKKFVKNVNDIFFLLLRFF